MVGRQGVTSGSLIARSLENEVDISANTNNV